MLRSFFQEQGSRRQDRTNGYEIPNEVRRELVDLATFRQKADEHRSIEHLAGARDQVEVNLGKRL